MDESLQVPSALKDLSAAVSTQAQVVNKTWLALIALAAYVIVHFLQSPSATSLNISFLGLGELDSKTFDFAAFLILAALTIAFCTAHAQQLRAIELAHRMVSELGGKGALVGQVSLRDLYDILREPGVSRVAPIAQMLRGKFQYDPQSKKCPAWLRVLTAGYYACVKLLVTAVYFAAPITAIVLCWISVAQHGFPHLVRHGIGNALLLAFGLGSLIPATQMVIADLIYIVRVSRLIGAAPKPDGETRTPGNSAGGSSVDTPEALESIGD